MSTIHKEEDGLPSDELAFLKNVRAGAKLLAVVFRILFFAMLCIVAAMVAVLVLDSFAIVDLTVFGLQGLFHPAAFAVAAITMIILAVGERLFSDVAKGGSPFTLTQAKRVRIIAAAFLLQAVFQTVMSDEFIAVIKGATYQIALTSSDVGATIIPIDIDSLLFSAVFFFVSVVLKYGAVLQLLNDDTI